MSVDPTAMYLPAYPAGLRAPLRARARVPVPQGGWPTARGSASPSAMTSPALALARCAKTRARRRAAICAALAAGPGAPRQPAAPDCRRRSGFAPPRRADVDPAMDADRVMLDSGQGWV